MSSRKEPENSRPPTGRNVRKGCVHCFVIVLVCAVLVMTLFVYLIGPWPNYTAGFADEDYFTDSIGRISQASPKKAFNPADRALKVGWATRAITPEIGGPLAGYGARRGAPSVGIRDDVFVKALAVSDGSDHAVIVGSDLLIVPENVADRVRETVSSSSALTGDEILFNASHNHSGPGGFAPGVVSGIFNGPFDEEVPGRLADAFSEVILAAFGDLQLGRVRGGGIDAPQYIRNRERSEAPVDSELSYLLCEQDSGRRCIVVSYSAHPTVLGADNLEISGEYPGYLMQHLQEQSGAEVIYLGGAVGSMGHRAPAGDTAFERSEAMGKALATVVSDALSDSTKEDLTWEAPEIEAFGCAIEMPPYQLRLSDRWRVSKHLFPLLGIDGDGWIQGVRIGDVVMIGMPADYSGEISVVMKQQMAAEGWDLWVLSFNGDYVGYVSPDRYYEDREEDGSFGYERGTMSWIGPHQEAYTRALADALIDRLTKSGAD